MREISHSFVLRESVFLSVFGKGEGPGRAVHFEELDLQGANLLPLLHMLLPRPENFAVTLVGSAKLSAIMQRYLAQIGVSHPEILIREGCVQIVFYPSIGRVRVEDKTTSVSAQIRIRVMIVEDSKPVRDLLQHAINQNPEMEVVCATGLPLEVIRLIGVHQPDVLTMDIRMPAMSGDVLLKKIMQKAPTPTILLTSARIEDGPNLLDALENGAIDYIQKPISAPMNEILPLLFEKIKTAARANIVHSAGPLALQPALGGPLDPAGLILIGSSTGGMEALRVVLTQLPKNIPPILVVQHIPPGFSAAFAKRMTTLCPFAVHEAADGDSLVPGRVLIAPGGKQMEIVKYGERTRVSINDGPVVNRHKPSVDVLFTSAAERFKGPIFAAILTGMGGDGGKGLLALRHAGAFTVAQSERTCVVFGMPREAIALGAVQEVVDLDRIANQIVQHLMLKPAA